MKTVIYQQIKLRCVLLLLIVTISFAGIAQNQYFIDSLNNLLTIEKSHFKRAKIFMSLSEEYREVNQKLSDNFIAEQNKEADKITDRTEKTDFTILKAFISGNKADTFEMRKQLMSIKDYVFSSGNDFLIGKYLAAEGNYLRMNHEETEESHNKINEIFNRSLNLLRKTDPIELSKAYSIYCVFLSKERGDPEKLYKTLNDYFKSVEKITVSRIRAKYFAQLGLFYFSSLRKPAEGLNSYLQALKGYLLCRDSINIAGMMINVGNNSYKYGDKSKSKKMILDGMNISKRNEELNPKKVNKNISNAYLSLANIYEDENEIIKQFDAYRKAIYYNNLSGNYYDEPLLLGNFGIQYSERGMDDSAMILQKKALELRIKFKNLEGVLFSYGTLATMAVKSKSYDSAIVYAEKSLALANQLRRHIYDDNSLSALYESYKALKNFERSNFYMEKFYKFQDSTRKARNETDVAAIINKQKEELLNLEFERKNSLSKLELERNKLLIDKNNKELLLLEQENNLKAYNLERSKTTLYQRSLEIESNRKAIDVLNIDKKLKDVEAKRTEESIKQQRKVIYAICIGGAIVLGLLFFVFREYNQKKNANKIIVNQKREVEEQKQLLEEKQTEIIDSINYAKRIQFTLLANTELLKNNLYDNFVFFKPKDIVSGDFYWATKKDNLFYIAVCDSTGHGVPGAFMSLLNISFLNEAINEKNISKPNEILNHVRTRLIENISKDGGQDGMDAILLCINKTDNSVHYAAANNAPIVISGGKITELEKDKMPVGKGENNNPFALRTVNLQKGDTIYLYTDGFADQFGGPKGKKFKYKQLNDLILHTSTLPSIQQKNELETEFNNWRGELEQVDDVCIIGIKI